MSVPRLLIGGCVVVLVGTAPRVAVHAQSFDVPRPRSTTPRSSQPSVRVPRPTVRQSFPNARRPESDRHRDRRRGRGHRPERPPTGFAPGFGYGPGYGGFYGYNGVPGYGGYAFGLNPPVFAGRPSYGFDPGYPAGGYGVPVVPPAVGYPPPAPPRSTLLDTRRTPLPPLPPVTVRLVNSGEPELVVTIDDAIEPGRGRRVRIPGGSHVDVTLRRDAGERLTQQFEVMDVYGNVDVQTKTRDVPPPVRYLVSVHQVRVQSVAIDRTAPARAATGGAGVIEDVNLSGKPIGSFELPNGPSLTDGAIDVLRAADAQGNAAGMLPLTDGRDAPPPGGRLSPLERAILQQSRGGGF